VEYRGRFRDDELVRFDVRPGITGLAQVRGRNSVDWDERLALDVQYVAARSLAGDLRILVATVSVVFGRSGIDSGEGVTMRELPVDRAPR
jgi:lipopolysaccharide/colanic/teichoic acid biosynthesis glycosyltransferase